MRHKIVGCFALVSILASVAAAQPTIDIVGSTSNTASSGTAKGNVYSIATQRVLIQAEFWLSFTSSETLSFYLYENSTEFGTYNQVYVNSVPTTGTGAAWYASPPINYTMNVGMYYMIAVSWTGTLSYTFGVGDSQPVSFGSHVHGYAIGLHPLGLTVTTSVNDQAIYHQRLTTMPPGAGIPSVTPVGAGCGGAGGASPTLSTAQLPSLGNNAFTLDVAQGTPNSQAFLFLSVGIANTPLPLGAGCNVYLDLPTMFAFINSGLFPLGPNPTGPSGTTSFLLPVPADPALSGVHIGAQAAIVAPAQPLGFTLTNALDLLLN